MLDKKKELNNCEGDMLEGRISRQNKSVPYYHRIQGRNQGQSVTYSDKFNFSTEYRRNPTGS